MSDASKLVSESTFETDVLKAGTPVLVDVWAEWCRRAGVPAREDWFAAVEDYEKKVQRKRK